MNEEERKLAERLLNVEPRIVDMLWDAKERRLNNILDEIDNTTDPDEIEDLYHKHRLVCDCIQPIYPVDMKEVRKSKGYLRLAKGLIDALRADFQIERQNVILGKTPPAKQEPVRRYSAEIEEQLDLVAKIISEFEKPELESVDNKDLNPIDSQKFEGVLNRLNKTGLSGKIVTDVNLYDEKLKEVVSNNSPVWKYGDNVYGFDTPDGAVHLDLRKMDANTPIHEFGHLWNTLTKENNRELWTKGQELIVESPYYWELVNQNPEYKHLSKEAKIDEALTTAIGNKGEAFANRSMKQKFVDWLAEMWKFIKQKFGINIYVTIEDMTLNDFADRAVK